MTAVVRDPEIKGDARPRAEDLSVGLLVSTQQPRLMVRPEIELVDSQAQGQQGDHRLTLKVKGLFPFGDSTLPLFYKGAAADTMRFSKPGVALQPPGAEGYVAREGSKLALVLENPTGFAYARIRARLRFAGNDSCSFDIENFGAGAKTSTTAPSPDATENPCNDYAQWSLFTIPKYAQVTLRANGVTPWFRDASQVYARSEKKLGTLTLRFESDTGLPLFEQNFPLEVQFVPRATSLFCSLVLVALFLMLGALISVVLRVSVPNSKRKRDLRDQLNELAKLSSGISTEVDSSLRVQLRVERLTLDELRKSVSTLGPNYADCAQRVEKSIPLLRRRIEAVRRLDATLTRYRVMMGQNPAPTRMEQIENHVEAASETLKQDNLSEEDWVFINQRLEAAQKNLREPTPAEKEAFDALLAGRWRALLAHFKNDTDTPALQMPPTFKDLADWLPDASLLPKPKDTDGRGWIQDMGLPQADLQLSALGLLWQYLFMLPPGPRPKEWVDAQEKLKPLLATPDVNNLREAKTLLRQLAENISETQIIDALAAGQADIVMDPAVPRPNQKIRFEVRFRDQRLNMAAARQLVNCRWVFEDTPAQQTAVGRAGQGARDYLAMWLPVVEGDGKLRRNEDGWSVQHFYEKDFGRGKVTASFFNSKGEQVVLSKETETWATREMPVQPSARSPEHWGRVWLATVQLFAALLVPLATLAAQTISGAGVGNWWELVALGFASDTIKSILVGKPESSA